MTASTIGNIIDRGTSVYYNGVLLLNVHTRAFDHTVQYDPSGTDKEMDVFRMRFTAHVHSLYPETSVIGTFRSETSELPSFIYKTNPAIESTAKNLLTVRRLLSTPRKEFRLRMGTDTIMWVVPSQSNGPAITRFQDVEPVRDPSSMAVGQDRTPTSRDGGISYIPYDTNNGPKPIAVSVIRIVGTNLIEVEFEIEVAIVECANSSNNSGILSNRWTVKETMDNKFYTTRTISGRMRVAKVAVRPADFLRGVVIPKLQLGFRRESIEITTSADGLLMDYQVVDQEIWAAAPFPAVMWEGTHTRSVQGAQKEVESMTFRLEGSKDVDKTDLLILAGRIMIEKLGLNPGQIQEGLVVHEIAVVDHLNSNVIEVNIELEHVAINVIEVLSVNIDRFLRPLDNLVMPNGVKYDKDKAAVPDLFGTASPAAALLCYLQSPCDHTHSVQQDNSDKDEDTVEMPDPRESAHVKTYQYTKDPPKDRYFEEKINPHGREAIYSYYEITSTQSDRYNRVQLPIARLNATPNDNTSMIVTFGPVTTTRVVHVTAKRTGAWPRLPKPSSFRLSSGQAFLIMGDVQVSGKAPDLDASRKSLMYEVEMRIPYAATRPTLENEYIIMGTLPWDTYKISDTGLKPKNTYVHGLVDNGTKPMDSTTPG